MGLPREQFLKGVVDINILQASSLRSIGFCDSRLYVPRSKRSLWTGFAQSTITETRLPDQKTFKKEERRSFGILLGDRVVPIDDVDLEKP